MVSTELQFSAPNEPMWCVQCRGAVCRDMLHIGSTHVLSNNIANVTTHYIPNTITHSITYMYCITHCCVAYVIANDIPDSSTNPVTYCCTDIVAVNIANTITDNISASIPHCVSKCVTHNIAKCVTDCITDSTLYRQQHRPL